MKETSKAVKASDEKRGIQSTSFKFSPDELALLERLAKKLGGRKAAVIEGLRALERSDNGSGISNAELLEELKRRLS